MLDAKKFMAIYVFLYGRRIILGFHSFSRVLNVLWVFSLLFTGLKIDRYMDGWTDG